MDMNDGTTLIWAVVVLVLLIGSLAARRLPFRQVGKMILAWVAIFAGLFVVFSFRPEIKAIWNRVTGELTGAPRQTMQGKVIELTRQDDGHFWLRAQLNGHKADFMVDSGATTTAVNGDTARSAALKLDPVSESVEVSTANGVIKVRTSKVPALTVGDFKVTQHDVVVSDGFGETNVVGMNFLDEFAKWYVEGDIMTLEP
jgi:aspartyl protease family protein